MASTFTTFGSVRRGCGHRHRTLEAALRCLRADQRGCERVRGYSDRSVFRLDKTGVRVPLSLDEHRYLDSVGQ